MKKCTFLTLASTLLGPWASSLALSLFLGASAFAQTAKFGDEIYQPIRGKWGGM